MRQTTDKTLHNLYVIELDEEVLDNGLARAQAPVEALPLDDDSVDRIVCYSMWPHVADAVVAARELGRVLRPGGSCVCTFSNRCFPTKAIRGWLSTNDEGHCAIVSAYFEFADGFGEPTVQLRNPGVPGDPLFAVWARRT